MLCLYATIFSVFDIEFFSLKIATCHFLSYWYENHPMYNSHSKSQNNRRSKPLPDNGTDRSNAAVDDIIELYLMKSFCTHGCNFNSSKLVSSFGHGFFKNDMKSICIIVSSFASSFDDVSKLNLNFFAGGFSSVEWKICEQKIIRFDCKNHIYKIYKSFGKVMKISGKFHSQNFDEKTNKNRMKRNEEIDDKCEKMRKKCVCAKIHYNYRSWHCFFFSFPIQAHFITVSVCFSVQRRIDG